MKREIGDPSKVEIFKSLKRIRFCNGNGWLKRVKGHAREAKQEISDLSIFEIFESLKESDFVTEMVDWKA